MRHPIPALSFAGSLITIAVVGFQAVAVAAPTADKPKYPYPEEMVISYVDECASQASGRVPDSVMRAICTCTIEEFQNTYPMAEFKKIGEAIEKGKSKDIPLEMMKITEECVKEVLTKPNA
jgi:hypothetical protein